MNESRSSSERGSAGADRRTDSRVLATHPIVLEVELHGYDEGEHRFSASRQTANLSRGGLLAVVDRVVEAGIRCVAHFPQGVGKVGRTMVFGRVSRSHATAAGCEVAVDFDTPLEHLEAGDSR